MKNVSVLLVDDVPENIEVVGKLLKDNGFQIAVAADGSQALNAAYAKNPDVILLDIQMPGLDGYTVCKYLKSNPDTSAIPVIFLTAKSDTIDILKGFECGGVDYITKPYNAAELLARVKTHSELKRIREDVELKKTVEIHLRKAKERVEELSNLKESLLANMSHEFRTPLISIIGLSEILFEEISNNPDLSDMAMSINSSGKRLLNTLNSILNLSELQSGNIKAALTEFTLNDSVKNVISFFEKDIQKKNLLLIIEETTPSIPVLSERIYLEQILSYVIQNAIIYTNEGSIIIKIDNVSSDQDECWGVVKITDTGIGISQEKQELIFEDFRQESEGYTRKFEGTGLGLTLAKKMADVINAKIQMESKVNSGTTLTIIIPGIKKSKHKHNT